MAATGLLALIDDLTAILDDVAAASKVAAGQTAGLAGDDLAVNAERLVGLRPSRELPIVGKVALGSLANKVVLVPLALALPAAAITPVLMFGGAYLCFEGIHKVLHWRKGKHDGEGGEGGDGHAPAPAPAERVPAAQSLRQIENQRVRQAIVTDIILSAEIVAVALGALADEPFATRATSLALVSVGMTIAIYTLVAGIVKLDDLGLALQESGEPGDLRWRIGRGIIAGTPWFMRAISVLGTVAMFLVGGGIIAHGLHLFDMVDLHGTIVETLGGLVVGVVVGGVVWAVVEGARSLAGYRT